MVRTDGKKNLSSVTDLKAVRIKKNLARLTELVNSSPETRERTLEYIKMAKTNAERQAEYKAKAKQSKKQLNYFISELAYQSLTDLAAEQDKAKIDVLESLLLGNIQLPSNNSELKKQVEILQIEKENLERDIFSMNTRNERLEQELRAAKAKGNGLLQAELDRYKTANENLVIERDKHYRRTVELDNQVRELKRQPDKLRAEITRLKHLEHDCQAIKANGERCDKPAKGKVEFHGVLINVCLQHQNQLIKTS